MPTPFTTVNELKKRVAAALSTAEDQLETFWDWAVADANVAATEAVYDGLAAAGYAPSQVAAWDRRRDYALDIGVYLALQKGRMLAPQAAGNDPPRQFPSFPDRRLELLAIPVVIAGVLAQPSLAGFAGDGDYAGPVGTGMTALAADVADGGKWGDDYAF